MSLIKKIKEYYKKGLNKKSILFTTPSHGQGNFTPKQAKELLGKKFFECDFSEIEGFDNLRAPEGILKNILDRFSQIYDSKQTFLLTNGSTSGMIAMMMTALKEDDKVLIARNCHISVYNALVLTGAVPIWFMPEFDQDWGIYKGLTKENVLEHLSKNNDIKAVVITSPTYEGLFSDIEGIADVCKERSVKLLVDEAHGALLSFGDFKTKPAILCGADMSIQSLHKTAGAPNPCSLLHISKESDIEADKVQGCLNLINTTSPSYPLILASEICVEFLAAQKGKNEVEKLLRNIEKFKTSLPNEIEAYNDFNDPTKLLIKITGKNSICASEILNEKYLIEEEFSNEKSMLFITGIGTDKTKLKKLSYALKKLLKEDIEKVNKQSFEYNIPEIVYTPREALQKETETIKKEYAINRVSAETLSEYPPGIPFIIAGEKITQNTIKFVQDDYMKVCK